MVAATSWSTLLWHGVIWTRLRIESRGITREGPITYAFRTSAGRL